MDSNYMSRQHRFKDTLRTLNPNKMFNNEKHGLISVSLDGNLCLGW